ncbi:hypothetical protein HPC44_14450 [Komagataeibacter oboediens]|uniref:Uncharacterized protein n=1 Tax=Komagataeibacter oboediens TaxID=65958 RepID=A0ABS5SPT7_9PROT|nr:hypothetical protein [Komagataeibacter oboediens]MBT0675485.1 hypothetical protein [Komagataeibacter oboediens]MBT0679913.1 hypothetical protein [Komagataeibacter oboediens]
MTTGPGIHHATGPSIPVVTGEATELAPQYSGRHAPAAQREKSSAIPLTDRGKPGIVPDPRGDGEHARARRDPDHGGSRTDRISMQPCHVARGDLSGRDAPNPADQPPGRAWRDTYRTGCSSRSTIT